MPGRDPFKGHRFLKDMILMAVRWYCRYPLSYRDVRDMLAERGIGVDAVTVYRWVPDADPAESGLTEVAFWFGRRAPLGDLRGARSDLSGRMGGEKAIAGQASVSVRKYRLGREATPTQKVTADNEAYVE